MAEKQSLDMEGRRYFRGMLTTLGLVGATTLPGAVISGCGDKSNDLIKERSIDIVYKGTIDDRYGRRVIIQEGTKATAPRVVATDGTNGPLDGRFDEIHLDYVPKGHELEKYANLQTLEQVYEAIKNSGEKDPHNPLKNNIQILLK